MAKGKVLTTAEKQKTTKLFSKQIYPFWRYQRSFAEIME